MSGNRRGQAFTLEGVIGALIILMAVVLALQAVDIAPSTDDEGDRAAASLQTQVDDTLAAAADRDALRRAATCVNRRGDPDRNVGNPGAAVTEFGRLLNESLTVKGYQYAAFVEHRGIDDGGDPVLERTRLYPATDTDPPETAVVSTRQFLLQDSDPVYRTQAFNCVPDPGGQTLNDSSALYIDRHPSLANDSSVYNVVRIRVISW